MSCSLHYSLINDTWQLLSYVSAHVLRWSHSDSWIKLQELFHSSIFLVLRLINGDLLLRFIHQSGVKYVTLPC